MSTSRLQRNYVFNVVMVLPSNNDRMTSHVQSAIVLLHFYCLIYTRTKPWCRRSSRTSISSHTLRASSIHTLTDREQCQCMAISVCRAVRTEAAPCRHPPSTTNCGSSGHWSLPAELPCQLLLPSAASVLNNCGHDPSIPHYFSTAGNSAQEFRHRC